MRASLSLVLASVVGISFAGAQDVEVRVKLGARAQFQSFTDTFGAVYSDEEERERRFGTFQANLERIDAHNQVPGSTSTLGVNQFADLTPEEWRARLRYQRPTNLLMSEDVPSLRASARDEPVPELKDWEAEGALTHIKNQGNCGSCWSFAATGALEAGAFIATRKATGSGILVALSEQQLTDCVDQNDGCDGGAIEYAFMYTRNHDVCSEEEYPYKQMQGACVTKTCEGNLPRGCQAGSLGYQPVNIGVMPATMQDMMAAVADQPVTIAILADNLQFYSEGIYQHSCGFGIQPNHAVLLVGYGAQDGILFWRIKNSWGVVWGERGYGRFIRDNSAMGACLMYIEASYPQMSAGCNPDGLSVWTQMRVWFTNPQNIFIAIGALLILCFVLSCLCKMCRACCRPKQTAATMARQAPLIVAQGVVLESQSHGMSLPPVAQATRVCARPGCGQTVPAGDATCTACGAQMFSSGGYILPSAPPQPATRVCNRPGCGQTVPVGDATCPACGALK